MNKKSLSATNDFCPQTLFLYGTYKEDGTPDFGLFCWFSYYNDNGLGVMMCIGGEKLTKDRIKQTKMFSANLVTEELLPVADYLGMKSGYDADKMSIPLDIEQGAVLPVPVLSKSPVSFELEVEHSYPLDDGEVFLCRVKNVLVNEELTDSSVSLEDRMKKIAPISTTCATYFSWDGKALASWGEAQNKR